MDQFKQFQSCFLCPICGQLYEDAFTTLCFHTFCRCCLTSAVHRHGKCPQCQQTLRLQDCMKDDYYQQLVKQIKTLKQNL